MIITSIDIGLHNLGLVLAEVSDETFSINQIVKCDKIDIKSLVTECGCKEFSHRLCMADYARHLFREYSEYFEFADVILVERQPPTGIQSLENLITYNFTDKVHLVHPRSVHKHLDFGTLGYEQRKIMSNNISERHLGHLDNYINEERKHDMSDALCMILFYIDKLKDKDLLQKEYETHEIAIAAFEQFRYTG